LWLLDSNPAACLGFIYKLLESDRSMNSRVVSENAMSFASFMSLSEVTLLEIANFFLFAEFWTDCLTGDELIDGASYNDYYAELFYF